MASDGHDGERGNVKWKNVLEEQEERAEKEEKEERIGGNAWIYTRRHSAQGFASCPRPPLLIRAKPVDR